MPTGTSRTPGEGALIDSYGLFSRTGYCEVSICLDGQTIGTIDQPTLRGPVIEKEVVKAVDRCLRLFEKLELTAPPVVVDATLLNARKYRIAVSEREHIVGVSASVDRDCCRLAGVTMEELPPDGRATALTMRPLLDSLYQAASRDGSMSFNSDGSLGPLWESL